MIEVLITHQIFPFFLQLCVLLFQDAYSVTKL